MAHPQGMTMSMGARWSFELLKKGAEEDQEDVKPLQMTIFTVTAIK